MLRQAIFCRSFLSPVTGLAGAAARSLIPVFPLKGPVGDDGSCPGPPQGKNLMIRIARQRLPAERGYLLCQCENVASSTAQVAMALPAVVNGPYLV